MLNLIVATQAEAEPVISKLKLNKTSSTLNCYEKDDLHLVVTGIGKCNTATACGWLANKTQQADSTYHKPVAWLNVGIAGHPGSERGTAIVAHKITDLSTEKVWFPHRIINSLPSSDLITVDRPLDHYKPDQLHDMEASAFIEATRKFTDAELVQTLKVVSDNEIQPLSEVTPKLATSLIADNIDAIIHGIDTLNQLSSSITPVDTTVSEAIQGCWHFSVSQKVRLERLLQRHTALLGSLEEIPAPLQEMKNSKTVLAWLQNKLDSTDIIL